MVIGDRPSRGAYKSVNDPLEATVELMAQPLSWTLQLKLQELYSGICSR